MKASAVLKALESLVKSRQPVFLWGGPGLGKSSVIKQLAARLNLALQDVRALLLDPVDLRGLPFLGKDGRSQWAPHDFMPKDGAGILFLDELNAAPAMVQAGCYQLVLDHKLGEYTLPQRLGHYCCRQQRLRPRRHNPHAHAFAESLRAY